MSDKLYLKLAETPQEITAAQQLRYQVFYEEMGAVPTEEMRLQSREFDQYDAHCHHLLVIDDENQTVIGTYRMLLMEDADIAGISLYTESEFDLSKLRAGGKRVMEVSRSCILKEYRNRKAINLLWQGIGDMVVANGIDYLVGTPSLPGTDATEHAAALSYMYHYYLAPEEIRPASLDKNNVVIPPFNSENIDAKREFIKLPPLLKGYLRAGALIGDGVFVDHQFNTVDVVILLPIHAIDPRYQNHYIK